MFTTSRNKNLIGAVLLLFLTLVGCASEQHSTVSIQDMPVPEVAEPEEPALPEPTVASLAVCGDVMSHMPVTNDAWDAEQNIYDYTPIMAAAGPLVSAADYAVQTWKPHYPVVPTIPDFLRSIPRMLWPMT